MLISAIGKDIKLLKDLLKKKMILKTDFIAVKEILKFSGFSSSTLELLSVFIIYFLVTLGNNPGKLWKIFHP